MKGKLKKKQQQQGPKMKLMIVVIISLKYFAVSDWLQSPS